MVSFLGWCVTVAVSAAVVPQPGDAKTRPGRFAPPSTASGLIAEIDAAERRLEACRSARHRIEREHPTCVWVWSVLRVREDQLERQLDGTLGQARPFSMSGTPTHFKRVTVEESINRGERLLTSARALLRTLEEKNDPARRPGIDRLRQQVADIERQLDDARSRRR
jgi:uncharacterized protein involved in exopolysaccharide biosynthesis